MSRGGWQEKYDSDAEQAIAYGQGQLATYDNVKSINAKVDYINQMGLGGAMIWALDNDDFTGQFCGSGKYPLLTAINQVSKKKHLVQVRFMFAKFTKWARLLIRSIWFDTESLRFY